MKICLLRGDTLPVRACKAVGFGWNYAAGCNSTVKPSFSNRWTRCLWTWVLSRSSKKLGPSSR